MRWKNLLSYGNAFTEVQLDAHKSTLVYGVNGVGKSTMEEAICFALYGKPFRKINKPLLVNSVNKKGMVCEIEFETNNKQIKVVRGINPDIFEIWIDGVLRPSEAAAKDYQDFLEKQILKMNYKSFTQIVILGSADYIPFMRLPTADRRAVIEDILDIRVFSVMDKILTTKVTENKEAVTENNYKIELLKQKIEIELGHLQKVKENTEDLVAEKRKKIDGYQLEEANLWERVKEIEKTFPDKPNAQSKKKLTNKKTQLVQFRGKMEDRRANIAKEIEFYTVNNKCPVCTQDISDEFKTDILDKKKHKDHELTLGQIQLQKELKIVEDSLSLMGEIESQINSIQTQIDDLKRDINFKQMFIKSIEGEIKELQTRERPINDSTNLETYQSQLEDANQVQVELSKTKKLMDVSASILRDGGIKSRIIKQYVPIINKLINQYLAALDFYVEFEFDENFSEKIKSRYRDEFSYESFSNGQKVRIDLAILIAWRAIAEMRNSVACNLLILDEIFDRSLDVEGTEEFIKLLKNANDKVNAFVISPKGDLLVDKFNHAMKVEFKNNFSRIAK